EHGGAVPRGAIDRGGSSAMVSRRQLAVAHAAPDPSRHETGGIATSSRAAGAGALRLEHGKGRRGLGSFAADAAAQSQEVARNVRANADRPRTRPQSQCERYAVTTIFLCVFRASAVLPLAAETRKTQRRGLKLAH